MIERETVIQVGNLTKRYGKLVAVDHISFSVTKGECFGFLGPNGAGKTTTARMLTGVIRPDGGDASIVGHPAGSLRAKQVTGVVPEMANAYGDLSAWDNLMLMADLYGIPRSHARERAASLLREVGLFERKADPAKAYSKGMKQRLILCMALVSDPEILFLDEPTSGLDVQSARMIMEMVRRLNRDGKTIFLTTHDMDEANELCDRIAVINKGRLIAIDAPERLRMATSGTHSVEVSFEGPVTEEALCKLPSVTRVTKMGDKFRLYTADPGQLAVTLVGYASSKGLRIVSLNTKAPTLEDAFVALIEGGGKCVK